MRLAIHQFGYNDDNYGVLLHDSERGETAIVDAGDATAAKAALAESGWSLTQIWITHHHGDHTAGLAELAVDGVEVFGPCGVDNVDTILADGDSFDFAGRAVEVIATPGHTLDMLNFYLPFEKLAFTGDTLFAMGCGRLFEGDADMMWASLKKLMALPEDTIVCSGHEYTAANGKFAMTIEPGNPVLVARVQAVASARAAGVPTVPSTLKEELETNPFLRGHMPEVQTSVGLNNADAGEVFARVRQAKDNF